MFRKKILKGRKKTLKKGGKPGVFGQVTLEFTFVLLLVFLLIIGLVRVFAWVGKDLALRRFYHENVLHTPGTSGVDPMSQTRPEFYKVTVINAYYESNIFDDTTK